MTEFLRLERLTKRFGTTTAVESVSLALERGQILALLGPSGSGKTTTLRLLAGFESPDEGRIVVEGEDCTTFAPVNRRFGMVFQHYALFPHLDAGENVAFGLQSLGVRGTELQRRVEAALALVDLAGYDRRRVAELSGGQQQRVALARALAPEPRVLLLDEPLSNLDPTLRERTRRELRGVIRRVGITTVIVTHEQEEAFDLGDRVAVLRQGRVEQEGTPNELYDSPVNAFVAGFVGRASAIAGTVVEPGGKTVRVRVEDTEWSLAARWPDPRLRRAILMIRPEALGFAASGPGALSGTVTERRFTGPLGFFVVTTNAGTVIEVSAEPHAAQVGDQVALVPRSRGVHLFPDGIA